MRVIAYLKTKVYRASIAKSRNVHLEIDVLRVIKFP